jgi:hypothetical protein
VETNGGIIESKFLSKRTPYTRRCAVLCEEFVDQPVRRFAFQSVNQTEQRSNFWMRCDPHPSLEDKPFALTILSFLVQLLLVVALAGQASVVNVQD